LAEKISRYYNYLESRLYSIIQIMKSCFGSAALLAAVSLLHGANAVEHPLLQSTDDFSETWKDRPARNDMITLQKELQYTTFIDHG